MSSIRKIRRPFEERALNQAKRTFEHFRDAERPSVREQGERELRPQAPSSSLPVERGLALNNSKRQRIGRKSPRLNLNPLAIAAYNNRRVVTTESEAVAHDVIQ